MVTSPSPLRPDAGKVGFAPFAGQRFAVVGLGRAGLPAALRLRGWGAEVVCWDDQPASRAAAEAAGLPVADPTIEAGFHFDALLLSPGIPHFLPRAHPAAIRAAESGVPVLCDAELLYRAVRESGSTAGFIGITGTNGKSTTTALIHHLLQRAHRDSEVGGNLGPAALGLPVLGDQGLYVLEMSSYMLERTDRLRFHVAVHLNLSPDHLDRHGGLAGYAAAKARIFAHQSPQDLAVIGMDDVSGAGVVTAARIVPVSGNTRQAGGIWAENRVLRDDLGAIFNLDDALALPGRHNAQNAAAAAAVVLSLGLTRLQLAEGLRDFPGLPHRQENVGNRHGVAFINDSKATNADSTERALSSYGRVIWIAGGVPKAGGIDSLVPLFSHVAEALLIGEAAQDFAAVLATHGVPHRILGTLQDAVPAALVAAQNSGADVVLLSPACASFDQFSGFDARGDAFRDLVAGLPESI